MKLKKWAIALVSLLCLVCIVAMQTSRIFAEPEDPATLTLSMEVLEGEHVAGADDVGVVATITNTHETSSAKEVSFEAELPSAAFEAPTQDNILLSSDDDVDVSGASKSVTGQKVKVTLSSLDSQKSFKVTFKGHLKEEASGEQTISGSVSATDVEPQEGNCTFTPSPRPKATLSIDKSSDKSNVALFSNVVYTIKVSNTTAKSIAHSIEVTDTLDSDLAIQGSPSVAEGDAEVDVQGQVVTITADTLQYNHPISVKITCTVNETSKAQIQNSAQVSATELDEPLVDSANITIDGNSGAEPGINISELSKEILDSRTLISNTRVSTDGSDIGEWVYWVTQSQRDAFEQKIDAANQVLADPALDQEKLDAAIKEIKSAKSTFEGQRQKGKVALGETVPPEYIDYNKAWAPFSQDGYKLSSELSDSDALSPNQKNYTRENTTDGSYGTTSYIISSAEWVNKAEGKVKMEFEGAYTEKDPGPAEAPVYAFTVCTAHNLQPSKVVENIQHLLSLYDAVVCLGVDSRGGMHTQTFTSDQSGTVSNWTNTLGFTGGVHYSERIPDILRNYIFGSVTAPVTDNPVHRPAAIYVSCDDCSMGGSSSADTPDFWAWITKNYIEKQQRYFSMSRSGANVGSGVIKNIYDPSGQRTTPDLDYTKSFSGAAAKKVPEISIRATVPSFIHIDSYTGTLDGHALDASTDRLELTGQTFEVGSTDYEYKSVLKVEVTGHVDPGDAQAGLDWFNCFTDDAETPGKAIELLSFGNRKNIAPSTKLRQVPDIQLEKTVSAPAGDTSSPKAQKGDTINWTIKATNAGNGATTNFVINDILPAGLTILDDPVSDKGTVTSTGSGFSVDTSSAPLAPKDSMTISYSTQFGLGNDSDTLTNTAIGAATLGSAQAEAAFTEIKPHVTISKSVDVETAVLNDQITYTISLTNDGSAEARNVEVDDELPTSLTPIGEPTCTDDATGAFEGNHLKITDIALPAGGTLTITVTAHVNETSEYGTVENTASFTYAYNEQDESELSSSASFEILKPELAVTKGVSNVTKEIDDDYAQTDDIVRYSIDVSNVIDKSLARDVELTDIIPEGLELSGPVFINGQEISSVLDEQLLLGNISPTAPVNVTYDCKVTELEADNITNSVSVTAYKFTPEDDKSASCDLEIVYPKLEIQKTVDREVAQADDVLNYTVTISNPVERTIAHNTKLEDVVPPEFDVQGDLLVDGVPVTPGDAPEDVEYYYQLDGTNRVYSANDAIPYAEADGFIHMNKACPFAEGTSFTDTPASDVYANLSAQGAKPCELCGSITRLSSDETTSKTTYNVVADGSTHEFDDVLELTLATTSDGTIVKHMNSECENLIDDVSVNKLNLPVGLIERYPEGAPSEGSQFSDTYATCPVCGEVTKSQEDIPVSDLIGQDPGVSLANFFRGVGITTAKTFGLIPADEEIDAPESTPELTERDIFNSLDIGDTAYGVPRTITFSGVVINNPECNELTTTASTLANHLEPVSASATTRIVHPMLQIKDLVDAKIAQADDILTYTIKVKNPIAESEARESELRTMLDENLELIDYKIEDGDAQTPPESDTPESAPEETPGIDPEAMPEESIVMPSAEVGDEEQPEVSIEDVTRPFLEAHEYVSASPENQVAMLEELLYPFVDAGRLESFVISDNNMGVKLVYVDGHTTTVGDFIEPTNKNNQTAINTPDENNTDQGTSDEGTSSDGEAKELPVLDLGTIAADEVKTITVTAKVKNVDDLDEIVLTSDTDGKYIGTASAKVVVNVVHPTLNIEKHVSSPLAQTDDTLNYEVIVTNLVGNSEARDVKFIDTPPEGLGRITDVSVERDTSAVTEKPAPETDEQVPYTPDPEGVQLPGVDDETTPDMQEPGEVPSPEGQDLAFAAETDKDTQVEPDAPEVDNFVFDETKFPTEELQSPDTTPIELDFGTIQGGEVVHIRYRSRILKTDTNFENVKNTASVSGTYIEPQEATATTAVVYPILAIEQLVDKDVAQTDDILNYTVIVSNPIETSVARDVVLCETLPGGLEFQNDLKVDGADVDAPLDAIPLGDISPDKPVTINFSALVTELEEDSLTPVASASGFNIAEVEAPVTTEIVYPALTIVKDVDKEVVNPQDMLNYTVTIENGTDRSTAHNAVFEDVLPEGLEAQGDAKVEGSDITSISPEANSYKVNLGDIPSGTPVTITYAAKATSDGDDNLENLATIYADHVATAAAPIMDKATTKVSTSTVGIEKKAMVQSVRVGENAAYTITLTNEGTGKVSNITVKDTLKSGGSYVTEPKFEGCTGTSSNNGQELVMSIPELAAGAKATITYTVSTTGASAGDFINEATVSAPTQESKSSTATIQLYEVKPVTQLVPTGVPAIAGGLTLAGLSALAALIIKRRK